MVYIRECNNDTDIHKHQLMRNTGESEMTILTTCVNVANY